MIRRDIFAVKVWDGFAGKWCYEGCMVLFDKHEKPVLAGLDEDADYAAVKAFEDDFYSTAENGSDDEYDRRLQEVNNLYADYYRIWS